MIKYKPLVILGWISVCLLQCVPIAELNRPVEYPSGTFRKYIDEITTQLEGQNICGIEISGMIGEHFPETFAAFRKYIDEITTQPEGQNICGIEIEYKGGLSLIWWILFWTAQILIIVPLDVAIIPALLILPALCIVTSVVIFVGAIFVLVGDLLFDSQTLTKIFENFGFLNFLSLASLGMGLWLIFSIALLEILFLGSIPISLLGCIIEVLLCQNLAFGAIIFPKLLTKLFSGTVFYGLGGLVFSWQNSYDLDPERFISKLEDKILGLEAEVRELEVQKLPYNEELRQTEGRLATVRARLNEDETTKKDLIKEICELLSKSIDIRESFNDITSQIKAKESLIKASKKEINDRRDHYDKLTHDQKEWYRQNIDTPVIFEEESALSNPIRLFAGLFEFRFKREMAS